MDDIKVKIVEVPNDEISIIKVLISDGGMRIVSSKGWEEQLSKIDKRFSEEIDTCLGTLKDKLYLAAEEIYRVDSNE